jgi:hypothetical protein
VRTESASTQNDYATQTAQPFTCFCFVAPLLFLYEVGMFGWGPVAMRSGADLWLRRILSALGFGQYFLLPLLTCGILLGWHHVSRRPWQVRSEFLVRMAGESVVAAMLLLFIGQLYFRWFGISVSENGAVAALGEANRVPLLLSFLGAGIYEELLFRLVLLSAAIAGCLAVGTDTTSARVWGVVATSLVFSAAHYQEFFGSGDLFQWASFGFRFLAGTLFSILYIRRGFGVTVGTHAAYDVVVAILRN